MTKKHWLAAAASIMTVCVFAAEELWQGGLSYILLAIAMIILPWVTAYKNRRGILICVVGMVLCNLLPPVHIYMEIHSIMYAIQNAFPLFYSSHDILSLLGRLLQIVFSILIVISMKNPLKKWALYVCPLLQTTAYIILSVCDFRGDLARFISLFVRDSLLFIFPPAVLMISAYLLMNEKLDRVDVKEVVKSVAIKSNETGFTYLDEYKKNMRK